MHTVQTALGLGQLFAPVPSKEELPLHWWQGQTGKWFPTTVLPLSNPNWDCPAVYIMVRRNFDGRCVPLYIGQSEDLGRRMSEHAHDKLLSAILMGGNELHVHLLAKSEWERFQVETDLRNGQPSPLNQQ